MTSIWLVVLLALGTALATGLGALPLAIPGLDGDAWTGRGDALASGFMVGASVGLLVEGAHASGPATLGGFAIGSVVVLLGRRAQRADSNDHRARPTQPRRALGATALLVGVMTVHSCAEGIGVGVAFGAGERFGLVTAIAIAIHNVPEGLAIALVAVPRGASITRAAWLAVVSSLPQPLFAVPAYVLVEHAHAALPWGFGLAAGAMITMAGGWLVPDALERISGRQFIVASSVGLTVMVMLQITLA